MATLSSLYEKSRFSVVFQCTLVTYTWEWRRSDGRRPSVRWDFRTPGAASSPTSVWLLLPSSASGRGSARRGHAWGHRRWQRHVWRRGDHINRVLYGRSPGGSASGLGWASCLGPTYSAYKFATCGAAQCSTAYGQRVRALWGDQSPERQLVVRANLCRCGQRHWNCGFGAEIGALSSVYWRPHVPPAAALETPARRWAAWPRWD